jgi:hypothetical protein
MSIQARLQKLERNAPAVFDPDACDAGPTFVHCVMEGEEDAPIPDDADRCLKCGEVHVLKVIQVVVSSREDIAAANERYGMAKGAV